MTWSRSRMGKACTETTPDASARSEKAGHRVLAAARSTSVTRAPVR